MKLAVLLLVCLAKISYQQGFQYYPYFYDANYLPNYWYGINGGAHKPVNIYITPEQFKKSDEGTPYYYDAQSRGSQGQDPRFFGLLGNFFSRNPLFPTTASSVQAVTQTVYSTVLATASIASIQTCIPVASFSAASLATTTCARKRRNFPEIVKDETVPIYPSEVSPIEPSSLPDMLGQPSMLELYSSRSDLEVPSNEGIPLDNRDARQLQFTMTVTSTITSYAFSTVVVKKTIVPGSSLLCMPGGFTTC